MIALLGTAGLSAPGGATRADVDALDRWIAEQVPASPLVGLGAVFVREGERNGIDSRALVAIAMHESVLGTAGSGVDIHNAFGWGPAIRFPSWQANIATVARGLAQGYVARGRDTLAAIQPVWAPVVAANDPTGLNSAWTDVVGCYCADLAGIRRGRSCSCRPPSETRRPTSVRLVRGAARGGRSTRSPRSAGCRWRARSARGRRPRAAASPIIGRAAPPATRSTSADSAGGGRCGIKARERDQRTGYPRWGSSGGVLNVERCGIRFKLLWRTFVGGNHWDHIHIGARRVGYSP